MTREASDGKTLHSPWLYNYVKTQSIQIVEKEGVVLEQWWKHLIHGVYTKPQTFIQN